MATDKADTSFMPMVIAACEQRESPQQRLLTDELAATMLPAPLRALLGLRVVRTRFAALMDRDAPGIWNSIACRKRYLDDAVARAIADGITQIVVLGAGFDTRAARFTASSEATAVEVDLPRSVARKRRRLGDSRVVLAPIDFEHDDLATVLTSRGYGRGLFRGASDRVRRLRTDLRQLGGSSRSRRDGALPHRARRLRTRHRPRTALAQHRRESAQLPAGAEPARYRSGAAPNHGGNQ